jgi:hypothetical protein
MNVALKPMAACLTSGFLLIAAIHVAAVPLCSMTLSSVSSLQRSVLDARFRSRKPIEEQQVNGQRRMSECGGIVSVFALTLLTSNPRWNHSSRFQWPPLSPQVRVAKAPDANEGRVVQMSIQE